MIITALIGLNLVTILIAAYERQRFLNAIMAKSSNEFFHRKPRKIEREPQTESTVIPFGMS